MNINEYIVKTLEEIGVDHVFGGSGQVNAPLMIALNKSKKIKTLIVRNEQAASFAACGYAMFNSDKLGVCFATGGPGAFNVMSGLGVALSDSIPVLAITGYEAEDVIGKGALAETSGLNRTPDTRKMFDVLTKKSFIITDPGQTCDILEEAINISFAGRPGPVHIHIPIDLTTCEVPNPKDANIKTQTLPPVQRQVEAAADAIASAIRVDNNLMLIIGYGAVRSSAEKEILNLVDIYQIPFATTMDGKGILPENHPLSLGVIGNSGDPGAKEYFDSANMVIAIGNSFAQNATYRFLDDLYKNKILIHINIDKNEIGKVYEPDYPILGDARLAVSSLGDMLSDKAGGVQKKTIKSDKWFNKPVDYTGSKIHPAHMVKIISDNLPENSIIVGDAGGHMLWLNCYLNLSKNQRYQNPGSFGPMASNVNSAIGIKCAHPDKHVISACGDGGYLMGGFELLTAVEYDIPVVWIIFNNGEFNIIKQFLLKLFGEAPMMQFRNPDYVMYAKACGAVGFRVEKAEELEGVFKKAISLNKPVIIDVVVEENVYPPFGLEGI